MNWEALGAAAELLGSIAVLATLIYLAIQVRHSRDLLEENRRVALSQVYADRAKSRIEDFRMEVTTPEIVKMRAERHGIDEDLARKRILAQKNIVHFDNFLYQNELGLISEGDVNRITRLILSQYDYWREIGVEIEFDRVENWYQEHCGNQ